MGGRSPIEEVVFYEFLANPEKYSAQFDAYWGQRGRWIDEEMKRRGWMWIVICGGEVVAGSPLVSDFPDEEQLIEIGKKYNRIPFVYGKTVLPEEIVA